MTTIALITGANKGIGLETAWQFGARGFTVLAGARDEDPGPSGILWGHLWAADGPADAYGPLPW